ncbi:SDR family NAD(P)-dependent oxidoreductase [Seongchinamella sediminis]|uniref:SDR family NAD(P)-dependent oxidoreductase n=1 Tax=Seongchinamella sediminis TaxID=2283635 RepID=A0A3L7DZR6_9GAMM|nr:SDR family NAD(P)-dependent oxidoreductase [Seongchinamella sediminis]RLQ21362.1 SDR family NAD(P)-dependent oxidoreductase [Seongchinamella sediminis]
MEFVAVENVKLVGGVAVITGAASGIGAAMARYAVQELGMKVVLADISRAALDRASAELAALGGDVLSVATDVSKPEALDALADRAYGQYGQVNLLVNNAGIELLGFSWELPASQWEQLLGVNIHGVVHGVRAFLPRMIASAEPAIVANLSSIAGISIAPLQASYVMSKHAVLAFSECLQLELAMKQASIQVSAVLPGPVKTKIFAALDEATDPAVAEHHRQMVELLDRNGMGPEEAAETIFHQLQDGQFWVSTHPELTRAMAQQRGHSLSCLATPQLDANSAFNLE